MKSPYSLKLILLCLAGLMGIQAHAQSGFDNGVSKSFHKIQSPPQLIRINYHGTKIPSGGHLQGIQRLSDSLLLITGSSSSYAYYLLTQISLNADKGQVKSVTKITDSPFRHAGGCQVYDHKLVVGVEDNHAKDKSDIIMISFNNLGEETGRRTIAHRAGKVKRSTAGAVGFTKFKTGQYVVIVGDWDSDYLDVYLSRTGVDSLFDSVTTFRLPGKKQPSYQAINLLTDKQGRLYLVGFSRFGFHNRVDLFELEFRMDGTKITNHEIFNFHCRGGAGFRYASGIELDNDSLSAVYSCSRGTRHSAIINIFDRRAFEMLPKNKSRN